ncbi:hypothetical protein AB3M83_02760 [Microbacterium sp. 179-B 1A2 NHS]|uniref:hypothetical protein n=1 Tax=Microbacterium sp. 179-B 1A2 NHS TaxID=3142383 RepID=UPI0039A1BB66
MNRRSRGIWLLIVGVVALVIGVGLLFAVGSVPALVGGVVLIVAAAAAFFAGGRLFRQAGGGSGG